ncbi:hypothetical protein F511_24130 [Dorcoceras hygrometricum]|uniref:Dystroglycan-like n=1 Tax=Dorcoceras hygrometricum TaxID=472368 RepID=A0A2Z7BYS2_9LAMI|nr:hypothetical protein F511_24130 [Dorcoceras hygrometricum]
MASSLISSSHHIDFDSVFSMEDASLAPVFESLIIMGLKEFLGCPAIFYEAALTEFFANGSVRDGVVVSTIGGTAVEISESVFAATFELPSEGLTDLSDVPKNLVFDARSLFSDSKEQAGSFDAVTRDRFMLMTAITFDVKINWSTLLFGVLKAMVTPGSRQAKGFAIQIGVVLSNLPGLELGEPRAFPPPRVLNEKTVHRFVHINEQVGMEKNAVSPSVKKTPKKRVVSKKRPVDSDAEVDPIVKKKRTTKGKPATTGPEVVPLQTIEPTADVLDEQPSKPKRKSQKRKRRLVLDDVDETSESAAEQPAAGTATGVQETSADVPVATQPVVAPADDPYAIIEQILTQLDKSAATKDKGDQPKVSWNSKPVTEEHMSIDDILMQISEDMMLPSVTAAEITKIRLGESISIPGVQERDLFYASLPRISIHDKGKEILVEDDPVRGNPARETVELICGDVDFLVQLRDRIMEDVVQFFHSFSLNKLTDFDGLKALKEKESLMLNWAETDSLEMAVRRRAYILAKYKEMLLRNFLESHHKYLVPGQSWTATASQIIDLLSVDHSKSLEVLVTQQKENCLPIEQPCTSTYLDTSIGSGAVLSQFFSQAKSKCWVRPMVQIDGMCTPIQGPEFLRSSCKLSLFVNKRQVPESVVEEYFVPHGCLIEPFQYWGAAPSFIKTWGWARVCTEVIRYSMFGCLRPVCKDIVVYNLGFERIPDYLLSAFQEDVCTDTFFGYLSGSSVQTESEIQLSSSDGDTVYRSPSPILQETDSFEDNLQFALGPVVSTDAQEEQLYIVESPESSPSMPQRQESSSSSSDSQMQFDSNDLPLDDTTEAQNSLPAATVDLSSLLDALQASLSQRMDDAHSEILSRLHTAERGLQTTLGNQNEYLRNLIQSVKADTDSLAIRSKFNALDAKILLLDGQVAAIRSEQLEFQAKIAADLLSLSTQIGDLVDYIRGGDAKKGEGSRSRPQPTPNVPSEGSGPSVVRLTDIADRIREDDRLQTDEGVVIPVMDRIRRTTTANR